MLHALYFFPWFSKVPRGTNFTKCHSVHSPRLLCRIDTNGGGGDWPWKVFSMNNVPCCLTLLASPGPLSCSCLTQKMSYKRHKCISNVLTSSDNLWTSQFFTVTLNYEVTTCPTVKTGSRLGSRQHGWASCFTELRQFSEFRDTN